MRMWAYRLVVFGAAFLLFSIQPMTSKAMLPGFGGSYLVWGATLVFFQAMLLVGYVYAHAVQRAVGVFRYARLHWLLLVGALVFVPLRFDSPAVLADLPLAAGVFVHLLASVSLPVVALSTTSLVLQRWLAVSKLPESENPYVLYGASNMGSMLALLSYPVLIEPLLSLQAQRTAWWALYLVTVGLHAWCVPRRGESEEGYSEGDAARFQHPTANLQRPTSRLGIFNWVPGVGRWTLDVAVAGESSRLSWFLLSAGACAVLVSTTNVITLDVAAVPLLWVLPLSLYLLCFVLVFKAVPWFPRGMRKALVWAMIGGVHLQLMLQLRLALPTWLPVAAYLLVLFVVCLNCCAALMAKRPADPRHLTLFYLILALGGLAGSVAVSWLMPMLSSSLVEYPLSFVLVLVAMAVGQGVERWRGRQWVEVGTCLLIILVAMLGVPFVAQKLGGPGFAGGKMVVVTIVVPVALGMRLAATRPIQFACTILSVAMAMGLTEDLCAGSQRVRRLRNFYGIYTVYDVGNMRFLKHGTTLHGRQYTSGPKTSVPLAYHHPTTPVGQVMSSRRFDFDRIAMIGLGTGALAAYALEGQRMDIYELDPDNLAVAEDHFTYLDMARRNGAQLSFIWGDGRIKLRGAPPASYDLLVIDAFSSGSIPVHLITVEALDEYFRALTAEGLILLNVSKKVLDVVPVVYSNVRAAGGLGCEKTNTGSRHPDAEDTHWMAISRSRSMIDGLTDGMDWSVWDGRRELPRPWTDKWCNILSALR